MDSCLQFGSCSLPYGTEMVVELSPNWNWTPRTPGIGRIQSHNKKWSSWVVVMFSFCARIWIMDGRREQNWMGDAVLDSRNKHVGTRISIWEAPWSVVGEREHEQMKEWWHSTLIRVKNEIQQQ